LLETDGTHPAGHATTTATGQFNDSCGNASSNELPLLPVLADPVPRHRARPLGLGALERQFGVREPRAHRRPGTDEGLAAEAAAGRPSPRNTDYRRQA